MCPVLLSHTDNICWPRTRDRVNIDLRRLAYAACNWCLSSKSCSMWRVNISNTLSVCVVIMAKHFDNNVRLQGKGAKERGTRDCEGLQER